MTAPASAPGACQACDGTGFNPAYVPRAAVYERSDYCVVQCYTEPCDPQVHSLACLACSGSGESESNARRIRDRTAAWRERWGDNPEDV